MATFKGYVDSTKDAFLLFEACRCGDLRRVTQRLAGRDRIAVSSGVVFVYDERESGIRRWTDGKLWSPSRISGNFLVYRELERKLTPAEKKLSWEKLDGGKMSNQKHEINAQKASEVRPENQADVERNQLSAPQNPAFEINRKVPSKGPFLFKANGLYKKTISASVYGLPQHLVCYYRQEDIASLFTPTQTASLQKHLQALNDGTNSAFLLEEPAGGQPGNSSTSGATSIFGPGIVAPDPDIMASATATANSIGSSTNSHNNNNGNVNSLASVVKNAEGVSASANASAAVDVLGNYLDHTRERKFRQSSDHAPGRAIQEADTVANVPQAPLSSQQTQYLGHRPGDRKYLEQTQTVSAPTEMQAYSGDFNHAGILQEYRRQQLPPHAPMPAAQQFEQNQRMQTMSFTPQQPIPLHMLQYHPNALNQQPYDAIMRNPQIPVGFSQPALPLPVLHNDAMQHPYGRMSENAHYALQQQPQSQHHPSGPPIYLPQYSEMYNNAPPMMQQPPQQGQIRQQDERAYMQQTSPAQEIMRNHWQQGNNSSGTLLQGYFSSNLVQQQPQQQMYSQSQMVFPPAIALQSFIANDNGNGNAVRMVGENTFTEEPGIVAQQLKVPHGDAHSLLGTVSPYDDRNRNSSNSSGSYNEQIATGNQNHVGQIRHHVDGSATATASSVSGMLGRSHDASSIPLFVQQNSKPIKHDSSAAEDDVGYMPANTAHLKKRQHSA